MVNTHTEMCHRFLGDLVSICKSIQKFVCIKIIKKNISHEILWLIYRSVCVFIVFFFQSQYFSVLSSKLPDMDHTLLRKLIALFSFHWFEFSLIRSV